MDEDLFIVSFSGFIRLVETRNRQASSSWNGVTKCEDRFANGTSDEHHNVCSAGKMERSHCEPISIKVDRWVDKKRAIPKSQSSS